MHTLFLPIKHGLLERLPTFGAAWPTLDLTGLETSDSFHLDLKSEQTSTIQGQRELCVPVLALLGTSRPWARAQPP
jgi:hypothetical protein